MADCVSARDRPLHGWELVPVRTINRLVVVALGLIGAGAVHASERPALPIHVLHSSTAGIVSSANHGNVRAETKLGWMYASGRGVPQNFYQSAKWYYRAATGGDGFAQFQLGLLYNKGLGVPVDYVLSYMWLNLSAAQSTGEVHDFRARLRDAIASKMTPEQMATAQHLALSWYQAPFRLSNGGTFR